MRCKIAAIALLAAIASTSCSSTLPREGNGDTDLDAVPSSYEMSDLCSRYRSFLVEDLGIIQPELSTIGIGQKIEWSADCVTELNNRTLGNLQAYNPRQIGPVEASNEFRPVEGFDEKAWLAKEDHWTKFRTQVGPWLVSMNFVNDSAQTTAGTVLQFDDRVNNKVFNFLIQVGRDIQS